jgi:putative acetyltransferase
MSTPFIKRTTASDPHFKALIELLDHELWVELREDQATYDQFNYVPDIQTVVIVYINTNLLHVVVSKKKTLTL